MSAINDSAQLIEEVALGMDDAKKAMFVQHMLSSISFISPIAMLSMAAVGTLALGPLSMTIMGLGALMSTWNAKNSHIKKLYEIFFEPHDKLVKELDDSLKIIVSSDSTLKKQYKKHMGALFAELKKVPKQTTQNEARAIYRDIYRTHMSQVIKMVQTSKIVISEYNQKRFDALVKQLKQKRVLK